MRENIYIEEILLVKIQHLILIYLSKLDLQQLTIIFIRNPEAELSQMNIPNILSVAALILGLYILVSFFYYGDGDGAYSGSSAKDYVSNSWSSKQNYHVGCYLVSKNITQYDSIVHRINQLKSQAWEKQYKQTGIMPHDFVQKKSVQVARNFQSFLDDYLKYKSRAQINSQLNRAVASANQDFKECVAGLGSFSQKDCLNDWEDYAKCTTQIDLLKKQLKFELNEKDLLVQKTKNLLNKTAPKLLSHRNPFDDAQKQFRRKDKQLEDLQKRLQTDIKLLYEKVTEADYNYTMSKNITLHSRELYMQCSEHRIQFRLCEELNQEMLSLGHGSIQNLGNKVQRKRVAINKIQNLLNQNQGRSSNIDLKKLYFENFQQYKKLFKLFVQTKAKIKKHCGCTQSEQIKLKQQFDFAKRQEERAFLILQRLNDSYKKKIEEINKVKNQRRILLQELQSKMKKVSSGHHQQKVNLVDALHELQRESNRHQLNIIGLNDKFNDLSNKCERIKSRISSQIVKVSKINDCLNKYRYYYEIKQKIFGKNEPQKIMMNEVMKKRLASSLRQFRI